MVSIRNGKKIFLHLYKKPDGRLVLPEVPGCHVPSVTFLNGKPVQFRQKDHQITLELPAKLPDDNDAVVVLHMDQNVEKLPVLQIK